MKPKIGCRGRVAHGVLAVLFGLLPCAAATLTMGRPAAASPDGPSFDALANAYGLDMTMANSSLPLGLTAEAAGPTAQAHLDSLGSSDALSSFPYPGDTVAGLPGLAGTLVGNLPVPGYPLVVTTAAGSRPRTEGVPGVSLQASSMASVAEAKAVVGIDAAGFTSSAQVQVLSDQSVQASAGAVFGTNLFGLVGVSGVESSATVTADASTGKLDRSTHLSIGRISAPGLALVLPPDSPGTIPIPVPVPGLPQLPPIDLPQFPLPLGGATLVEPDIGFEDGTFTIALPILPKVKFAVPAKFVLAAFEALGVKITYQAPEETTTGVIGPALSFSKTLPALPKNNYVNGETPVRFDLGRVTASVTLHPVAPTGSGFGIGTGGLGSGSTTGGPTGTTGFGAGSTSSEPTAGTDLPAGLGDSTGGGATTPLTPASGTGSTSTSPTTQQAGMSLAGFASTADLSGLYLTCIGIAVVALASASVLRLLGVRLPWGS
jgi:hypothetical protein